MFRKVVYMVALLFVLGSVQVQAGEIEISPFIGYRFGGGFEVTDLELFRIDVDSSVSYGVSAGYVFKEKYQVEFMWDRQPTQLVGKFLDDSQDLALADANFDQYLGNFLYHFGDETKPLRPFVLAGLGVASLNPDGPIEGFTKFSYGVGGGIKYFFTPKVGLRLQARYTPTYISSEDNQVICDQFGCFIGTERKYINQGEFSAGAFFRF